MINIIIIIAIRKMHLFGDSDNADFCIKNRSATAILSIIKFEFHGFRFNYIIHTKGANLYLFVIMYNNIVTIIIFTQLF